MIHHVILRLFLRMFEGAIIGILIMAPLLNAKKIHNNLLHYKMIFVGSTKFGKWIYWKVKKIQYAFCKKFNLEPWYWTYLH